MRGPGEDATERAVTCVFKGTLDLEHRRHVVQPGQAHCNRGFPRRQLHLPGVWRARGQDFPENVVILHERRTGSKRVGLALFQADQRAVH